MQLTDTLKKDIVRELFANMEAKQALVGEAGYPANRHAHWLNINPAILSEFKKKRFERKLSEGEWIRVGKKLHVSMDGLPTTVVETKTFKFIKGQMQACMEYGMGGVFVDDSSLGKTFTAEVMDLLHPNVAYVDCSRITRWSELVRAIYQAFGFKTDGTTAKVRQKLIENVYGLEKPLIILDEAGDLSDQTILHLKGLWNELETLCGWYIMGANGLRAKLQVKMDYNKVGYEEWFNRLGNRFQSVTGSMHTSTEKELFKRKQIEEVISATLNDLISARLNDCNISDTLNDRKISARLKNRNISMPDKETLANMVADCDFNLRRVRTVVIKYLNN